MGNLKLSDSSWESSFLLDIPEIDEQHKKFFQLLDKAKKQINLQNRTQTDIILIELENYFMVHYDYEEKLMEAAGYPKLELHKKQHKYFESKIKEMRNDFHYNNPELFEKLVIFLKKWFVSHILREDLDYKTTVKDYLSRNSLV